MTNDDNRRTAVAEEGAVGRPCTAPRRDRGAADMTTGPINRHLLKTTSFMLVTMIFQTLYFLIDLYWVGRLGTEAVAAVGIAGNLTFIVLALTQMLGSGPAVISHAVAERITIRRLSCSINRRCWRW